MTTRRNVERESFLSQAVNEVVEEMLELLGELLDDDAGEFTVGRFDQQPNQDELREAFERVMQSGEQEDLSVFEDALRDFKARYGQDAWDRQQALADRRHSLED